MEICSVLTRNYKFCCCFVCFWKNLWALYQFFLKKILVGIFICRKIRINANKYLFVWIFELGKQTKTIIINFIGFECKANFIESFYEAFSLPKYRGNFFILFCCRMKIVFLSFFVMRMYPLDWLYTQTMKDILYVSAIYSILMSLWGNPI